MATLSRDSEPVLNSNINGGATVVFIDTSLDTHLAVIVSENDTVSDLKKRILSEHPLSFPKIGQIQIHAIKVKRKGYFYHLSDSMFVRSAFHGINKSWFISVDASALEERGQNELLCSSGSPNQLVCLANGNNVLIGPVDTAANDEEEECPFEHPGKKSEKYLETDVNHEFPSLQIEHEMDGSSKGVKDAANVCEEVSSVSVPSANKRKKSKRTKGDVQNNTSKEKIASVDNLPSFASKKVSSNKFQVPQWEKEQDQEKEIPTSSMKNHGTESMKEASEPVPGTDKHRKRKRSLTHDSEEMLKIEAISQKVEADKFNEAHKERIESMDQSEFNNDMTREDIEYKHDMVTEVVSDIKHPAKKKQKSELNLLMINDSNVDQSAKVLNDTDPTRTSEYSGKKNGKKKSSIPHEIQVVSSSRKDVDFSIIPGVQEKISEDGQISKGTMRKTTLGNTEIGTDSCKEGFPSEVKKVGNNKMHCDIDIMNIHPPNGNKPNEPTEANVNIVVNPGDKSEAGQTAGGAEDGRVVLPQNDPAPMLLEKCMISYKDDTDVNVKGLNVTSQVVDVNGMAEPKKSQKKKKRKKKAKDSDSHKSEADQAVGAEEGREILPQNDHTPMLLEDCTLSYKDNTATNIKGLNVTSEVVDVNGMAEPVKSEKKKKRTKKAKYLDGGPTLKEGVGLVDAPESEAIIFKPLSTKRDPASGNSEKISLIHVEGKSVPQDKKGAILSASDMEDGFIADNSGSLQQDDPMPKLLQEECTLSYQDNTDANIKGLNVTSKVADVNGMVEPVKSEKKKNKTKKVKESDGRPLNEGVGPVDASESGAIISRSLTTKCSLASGNTEAEGSSLNQADGKNIQQDMKGTVPSATDKEDGFGSGNADSLQQIKTAANTELVGKTQRKKSSNKQSSKSVSDTLTKDESPDLKKPSPSSNTGIDASPSSKRAKKNKSARSPSKSSKINLEPLKNLVGLEPSDYQFVSVSNGSSQFPLNTPKGVQNVGPIEANGVAKGSTRSSGENDENNLETPLETNKINSDHQFRSQALQHEAHMSDGMLFDKMNGSERKDLDQLTGQDTDEHKATKGQTHAESLSSSQQMSSKAECDVLRTHPDKKVPNVHKTGQEAKLSSRSNSDVSSIRENKKPKVGTSGKNMDLDKQREELPTSNSTVEGVKKMVQKKARVTTGNNVVGVAGKTQQHRSLFSGGIFKDDSSGTSEDVDEVHNSDASTRTPSDNSLLSDFSDNDSSAGSFGGERLENGGRSAANMSSTKGMSIDQILKSSRRYKKAKITASQLEGTESQPEFVPDSLA